ncbi:MAG: TetR/AcrR family transcriptional regulator [Actinomycetota bacterium]
MPSSDTTTRLLDAAVRSVREHGYTGTGMQDLLRDAGVSSSSMYHFFPGGKEELVAAAIRRDGHAAAERLAEVLSGRALTEAIDAIFGAAADEMAEHDFALGCPIGVPATEVAADSEPIREAASEVFAAWAASYAAGLRSAGYDAGDADRMGRFIVATYEGAVALARATRSTVPYADAAAFLGAHLDR